MLSTHTGRRLSWHILVLVSRVFSRQLLVKRVVVDGWPAAHGRRAARDQPGDGVQVGPPLSGRGPGRARGPQLATASLAAPLVRRGRRPTILARAGRPALRPGPPGAAHSAIPARPSTASSRRRRPQPAPRRRPGDRGAGPLRRLPPGRARPPGPQEARPGPDGGGWRVLGRLRRLAPRPRDVGYEHLEVVVDDASRYAVVVPVADERGRSASARSRSAATEFAEARDPDRAGPDRQRLGLSSHAYGVSSAGLGARHKRTRPFRPQTNGKAERFIQTLLDEWAYARAYRSNGDRAARPPAFVDFYNHGRPHTAHRRAHPSTLSTTSPDITTSRSLRAGRPPPRRRSAASTGSAAPSRGCRTTPCRTSGDGRRGTCPRTPTGSRRWRRSGSRSVSPVAITSTSGSMHAGERLAGRIVLGVAVPHADAAVAGDELDPRGLRSSSFTASSAAADGVRASTCASHTSRSAVTGGIEAVEPAHRRLPARHSAWARIVASWASPRRREVRDRVVDRWAGAPPGRRPPVELLAVDQVEARLEVGRVGVAARYGGGGRGRCR